MTHGHTPQSLHRSSSVTRPPPENSTQLGRCNPRGQRHVPRLKISHLNYTGTMPGRQWWQSKEVSCSVHQAWPQGQHLLPGAAGLSGGSPGTAACEPVSDQRGQ